MIRYPDKQPKSIDVAKCVDSSPVEQKGGRILSEDECVCARRRRDCQDHSRRCWYKPGGDLKPAVWIPPLGLGPQINERAELINRAANSGRGERGVFPPIDENEPAAR